MLTSAKREKSVFFVVVRSSILESVIMEILIFKDSISFGV
jgi:hypothetical protein